MKKNRILASHEAMLEARYRAKLDVALQMGLDAAMIAANEVLSLGKGRAGAFGKAYITAMNEMSQLFVDDDDPDVEYARDVIDRRIKSIVGEENFREWDERYGVKKR